MDEYATSGMVFYLFGLVCALWAQETRRSAWLWFFAGALAAPITGIVLVYKNAQDVKSRREGQGMFSR